MAVPRYCESLANVLAAVSDIDGGGLSTTTEPTLVDATFLWDRAATVVRSALLREGLSVTLTADSLADEIARTGEMLWASLFVLTAKSSLLEGQERSARLLLSLARASTGYTNPETGFWVQGDLGQMRQTLLGNGAAAELSAPDTTRNRTSSVESGDPNLDLTPGAGSVPYLPQPTFEDGDPL